MGPRAGVSCMSMGLSKAWEPLTICDPYMTSFTSSDTKGIKIDKTESNQNRKTSENKEPIPTSICSFNVDASVLFISV